jgi:hypothetical protein
MKKIKNILFSALLGFLFISITSCDGGIGDAPTAGSDLTNSALIVGWGNPIVTESYFQDIGILNNTYPINILGGGSGQPTTSDITVTISVNAAETTATEGNEYTLPNTTVTIPAGQTIGQVPVNVNTGAFNLTQPTKLVLDATITQNGVVVSQTEGVQVINFVGCKSTLADYDYEVTITSSSGSVYGPHIEPLTMESVNSFLTYSAGTWDPPLNPGHGVRFGDICGTLTMPAHQGLVDIYSNDVTPKGTATVDANGNFTLNYTIDFSSGPRDYKAVYIRQIN